MSIAAAVRAAVLVVAALEDAAGIFKLGMGVEKVVQFLDGQFEDFLGIVDSSHPFIGFT